MELLGHSFTTRREKSWREKCRIQNGKHTCGFAFVVTLTEKVRGNSQRHNLASVSSLKEQRVQEWEERVGGGRHASYEVSRHGPLPVLNSAVRN